MGKIIGRIFDPPAAEAGGPDAQKAKESFACELCGKEYKTADGLARHMAEKHPIDVMPDPGQSTGADTESGSETEG